MIHFSTFTAFMSLGHFRWRSYNYVILRLWLLAFLMTICAIASRSQRSFCSGSVEICGLVSFSMKWVGVKNNGYVADCRNNVWNFWLPFSASNITSMLRIHERSKEGIRLLYFFLIVSHLQKHFRTPLFFSIFKYKYYC